MSRLKAIRRSRVTPQNKYSVHVPCRSSLQRRDDARHSGADYVQQAEVKIDGAYASAFFRTFRAKIQELDDAREVFAGSRVGNAGNIANLGGKRLLNARADQRAAVGDEELQ